MSKTALKICFIILAVILTVPGDSIGQEKNERIKTFIDLAKKELRDENYRQALVHLDSASALNPDLGEIYEIRAAIYSEQDRNRRAINEYTTAIRFDPDNPESYYQRAILRHEVGDHRTYSMNDINKAIELDPENTEYYLKRAYFLTSTSYPAPEYNLAIESVTEAIRLEPENGKLYNIRANYKSESGQQLASLVDYSKAIELDSSKPEYYYNRGLTYFFMENFTQAIEDINAAIQLDPLNEEYLITRGQARFNLHDYETAILDFSLGIDTIYKKISEISGKITLEHPLNQTLRRAYLYRGSALLQSENVFEACEDFEAATTLGDTLSSQYIKRYCR